MHKLACSLLACLSAACSAVTGESAPSPGPVMTSAIAETPAYSFQVSANDQARLHAALGDYAVRSRFALSYRDPPSVPPQTRLYELRASDARIDVFNPFDPRVFFFGIFGEGARAAQVCRTLMAALTAHGFTPAPPVDFGNPPPFCPT
jgi:hypothetical protein